MKKKRTAQFAFFDLRTRICFALFCSVSMTAYADIITVTNTNDSGPGSLRQALANANNGDTINFAVTGAITLTSGGLGITKNVTISGPGATQLAVNGNQALFVFGVFPQRTVNISGLRIRNAQVGVYNNQGTVSDNQVTLTVSSCVLSGNSNAGISNSGTVTVSNCALSGNSGGMTSFGTLTVSYCEISGNSGDGICNRAFSSGAASLTVVNSNVSDNHSIGISNYVDEFAVLTTTIRSTA